MSEQQITGADTLYLDAEYFALIAEQQPLEARDRVLPGGCPFPGLLPSVGPVRLDEGP